MIIDWTYGAIICGIIFISVFGFFAYLLTTKIPRFVNAPKIGGLLAALPAGLICFPLYQLWQYPLHVIDKYGQGQTYMLVGSSDYDLGNGKTGKVSFEWGKSHVVNQSDAILFVDVVHYGLDSYVPEVYQNSPEIAPHSIGIAGPIDYYPLQIPPQQLELKASEAHRKFWLRIKKADE